MTATAPELADPRRVAPPVLACADLNAGYGDVTVVRGFDLSVEAGTVVAILGPNGAGKTTLLSTLAGLLPAQSGTVAVDGQVLRPGHPGQASRRGVVLVPDDRALFSTLTVEQNLKVARGRRKTAIESAFDRFPALARRRRVSAGNLSGGEQQMLAVARALIQEPRLLLIDEMSMGLAPVIVETLMPMVRQIADDTDAAVVIVEQHVALALDIADRAVVLAHGAVNLDRPATDLRQTPDLLEAAYLGELPAEESNEHLDA